MAELPAPPLGIGAHGSSALPSVNLDSWNLELRDDDGFIGDRASKGAFSGFVEAWREKLRAAGEDPLGDGEMGRKKLDRVLTEGSPEAGGIVLGAIEDFAQVFADVIRRFLKDKAWRGTERIAVGGGLRESRVGELAIGRAGAILKGDGVAVDLVPIHHHPDEAALIGALHLAPPWIFSGHDSVLAADIGGTNIRAGVILPNLKKATDLSKASVWKSDLWRHRDDKPTRDQAIERLTSMLSTLAAAATREGLTLAPFIGIGCPGFINEDGSIDRGAQNLPGNWHARGFNLPEAVHAAIPTIGAHKTAVVLHNDAVMQGLSEIPFMQDLTHWGVLTIGTGLGNARFTNRDSPVDAAAAGAKAKEGGEGGERTEASAKSKADGKAEGKASGAGRPHARA